MTAFQKAAALPKALRADYLKSLPEPQEWFLEERVHAGEVWEHPGRAYAALQDATLVEFHAPLMDSAAALTAFRQIRPFKTALAPSFDHAFLHAAEQLGAETREVAYLFRTRQPRAVPPPEGFTLRAATRDDLTQAMTVGADFFASPREAAELFEGGQLWTAWDVESNAKDPTGFGVTTKVTGPYHAVDLGMVVAAPRRNQGLGAAIIATLADIVTQEGHRPICGCAKGNPASKAALDKAGFIADHRLLRVDFPN